MSKKMHGLNEERLRLSAKANLRSKLSAQRGRSQKMEKAAA